MELTLQEIVASSDNIVFFGGAGVSTESGIPDYRSAGGLYGKEQKYAPETMLSHSFFLSHTGEFFDFHRENLIHPFAKPNAAHLALARLEQVGKLKAVITQNVDGLHQQAGSKNVLELHGSVYRNYCMSCQKQYGLEAVAGSTGIPRCSCGGIIRPDVVLYGESLDEQVLERAQGMVFQADVLLVGGSSLAVYPAAGLLQYYRGRRLVLLNKTPTPLDRKADLIIRGSIGKALGELQ